LRGALRHGVAIQVTGQVGGQVTGQVDAIPDDTSWGYAHGGTD
jgi:hypothetical protein